MASRFFDKAPPRVGGLQSTTQERWRPELRERQSPVPAEPESSGDQTIDLPMYTDHLIINYKGTLACQIACMGVKNLGLTDLLQAGRLCHHLSNWSIITQDWWVLNTVRGYLMDFVSEPHQQSPLNPPHCSSEQTCLIQEELTKLLKKQAIRQLEHPAEAGFLSNIFLVPKKDGGQRPVINLKALNRLKHRAFQDGGYPHGKGPVETRGLACQGGFEGRLLCNPHTPNPLEVSQISSPQENVSLRVPTIRSVISPWVFTKTVKPVLREMGMRLVAYNDDILILAESKGMALDHVEALVYLLECLGFVINIEKSVIVPNQTIEFLGLKVDSVHMEF